jgi:dimeric dUTPase (all-alpha-NTP-PPase superfamily)
VQTQTQVMLDLQEAMNSRVHADWREQEFEWYRAIWIECAELMDHYGWKWWKQQIPDSEQVKLELVDIWHFGLSILLVKGASAIEIADQLKQGLKQQPSDNFHLSLEAFAGDTLSNKDFSIEKFALLLREMDMSFEALYIAYVGKNVLNFFRQDHGYKEGTYQKIWGGEEDNEHLVNIVKTLDTSTLDFKELLYNALSERYTQLCS